MKCKICKTDLRGRQDKMFCSTACKNYYHTNLRRVNRAATVEIDKILHRNRAILLELMGKQKVQRKVERILLDKKKFNFKYHTHIHKNSASKIYHYVYDFAWMSFSTDEVLIVRKRN
ncbi:MAG: hypothetical protein ACPG4Z_00515 [Chitinophagales bacterium]